MTMLEDMNESEKSKMYNHFIGTFSPSSFNGSKLSTNQTNDEYIRYSINEGLWSTEDIERYGNVINVRVVTRENIALLLNLKYFEDTSLIHKNLCFLEEYLRYVAISLSLLYGCQPIFCDIENLGLDEDLYTLGLSEAELDSILKMVINFIPEFFVVDNEKSTPKYFHPNSALVIKLLLSKHFSLINNAIYPRNHTSSNTVTNIQPAVRPYKKRKYDLAIPFVDHSEYDIELSFGQNVKKPKTNSPQGYHSTIIVRSCLRDRLYQIDFNHTSSRTGKITNSQLHKQLISILGIECPREMVEFLSNDLNLRIGYDAAQKRSPRLNDKLKDEMRKGKPEIFNG